jgi:Ca-activated chloride channel family protein
MKSVPFPKAVLGIVLALLTFVTGLVAGRTWPEVRELLGMSTTLVWLALVVLIAVIGILMEIPISPRGRWQTAIVAIEREHDGARVGIGFVVSESRILTPRSVLEAALEPAAQKETADEKATADKTKTADVTTTSFRVTFPHVSTGAGPVSNEVAYAEEVHGVVALDVSGRDRLPRRALPFKLRPGSAPGDSVLLYRWLRAHEAGGWVEGEITRPRNQHIVVTKDGGGFPVADVSLAGSPLVKASNGHLLGIYMGFSKGGSTPLVLRAAEFERLNKVAPWQGRLLANITAFLAAVGAPLAAIPGWLRNRWKVVLPTTVAFVLVLALLYALPRILRPDVCTTLDLVVSTEKDDRIIALAEHFGSARGGCDQVRVVGLTSGAAMEALADKTADGWNTEIASRLLEEGQLSESRPHVWMPTSSMWTDLLELKGGSTYGTSGSVAKSPMVIAVPKGAGKAVRPSMGWLADKVKEDKSFVLGRDEPVWSTSGLAASVLAYDAATTATFGQSADRLSIAQAENPDVVGWVRSLETGVDSYGEEATRYLRDLYCGSVAPVDAIVVQEQMVKMYNEDKPGGSKPQCVRQGAAFDPILPRDGTLVMDHPYVFVRDLNDDERKLADDFYAYLTDVTRQDQLVEDGFRRYDSKPVGRIIKRPTPEALDQIRAAWDGVRKNAQVILLLDSSASLSDEDIEDIRSAARSAVDLLSGGDELSVWTFDDDVVSGELRPVRDGREGLDAVIDGLARRGTQTKLVPAVEEAHRELATTFAEGGDFKTQAVVLLTDGQPNPHPGDEAIDAFVSGIAKSENPIRIYTIPYGSQADECLLDRLARESGARYYGAGTNKHLIGDVLRAVFGNFGTRGGVAELPSTQAALDVPPSKGCATKKSG